MSLTYQSRGTSAFRTRVSGITVYRAFFYSSLAVFVLLLAASVFPLYALVKPELLVDLVIEKAASPIWAYGVFGLMLAANAVFLNLFLRSASLNVKYSLYFSALLAVFVANACAGGWLGKPSAALYSVAAVFLCLNFSFLFICPDDIRRKAWTFAAYTLAIFMLGAVLVLGLPQGRFIGGIHPNSFGGVGLGLCLLSLLVGGKQGGILFAIGLTGAIAVNSRYAIVCSALALALYALWMLVRGKKSDQLKALGLMAFGVCVVLIIVLAGIDLLHLQSADRGLGSGISGRDLAWANFWPQFTENYVLGYGFRQRQDYVGAHNGFLNTVLETGVLGGFLILLSLIQLTRLTIWSFEEGGRETAAYAASFAACLAAAQLQPQFVTFADPMGLLCFLFLSVPLASKRSTPAGRA